MYDETDETGEIDETSHDDGIEVVEQPKNMGVGTILLFVLFSVLGALLYSFILAPLLGMN